MQTFRPDKQHITMPDGTIFQAACYASDYDWSQHVDEKTKTELGEVKPDYDWTQHVSVKTRDHVRLLCCEQAAADHLAYASNLGEQLPDELIEFIARCDGHCGTARKYDDAPTPEAKRARKLFAEAEKAKPASYAEKLAVQSVLAEQPKLKPADALALAKEKMGE